MKTKFFWFCCLAGMAMAIGLFPLMAQDAFDPVDEPDPAAQRERDDVRSAMTAVKRYGTAIRQTNSQATGSVPATSHVPHPGQFGQPPTNFTVAGTANLFSTQNRFSQFTPELAKAINASHVEVAELIKELKASDADDDKQEIKSKIKAELDLQYDAYLTHHEKPLKELEERVAKLREEFEARKNAKDDLVKLRLDTIWYDSLGLGWPNSRQINSFFNPLSTAPANPNWTTAEFPPPRVPTSPTALSPGTDGFAAPESPKRPLRTGR